MSNTIPCAALHESGGTGLLNCSNTASKVCGRCHLVWYCSQACQKSHWQVHKADCNSSLASPSWLPKWAIEGRKPTFVSDDLPLYESYGSLKFLWGNVPAIDVLNLPKNEGADYGEELSILFAACGDLRNVVKTLASIPSTCRSKCNVHINDRDVEAVFRGIVLILLALSGSSDDVIDCMIHVWYSAFLTREHCATIDKLVRPIISDVVEKIQGRSPNVALAKTVQYGVSSIRIVLLKSQWEELLRLLDCKLDLQQSKANRRDIAFHRIDHVHRDLLNKRSYSRVARSKFRETGVLRAFGADLSGHTIPNATLFDRDGHWLQKDCADPIHGWWRDDILQLKHITSKPANDIYGQLHLHLHDTLASFTRQCQDRAVSFTLTVSDLRALAKQLASGAQFDRIEVSNVMDAAYLGVGLTLTCLKPLLSRRNKHAAVVALFMNAINLKAQQRLPGLLGGILKQVMVYLQVDSVPSQAHDPVLIRLLSTTDIFLPFDDLFGEYCRDFKVYEAAQQAQFKVNASNTIVEQWPWRFRPGSGDREDKERFWKVHESGCTGAERYMEWKHAS